MLKLIPSGSYDFGMPTVSLMNVWSRGPDRDYMRKRAALMDKRIAEIRPETNHSFLHLISLGSHEVYGGNRNGDTFNEKSAELKLPEPKKGVPPIAKLAGGLEEFHSTFLKSGGHVFKHHKNTDPKLSIGDVVAEMYNPEMHRGELIIKVANDHPDWKQDLTDLADKGREIPFSMSCKIAKDLCSYCGNRSRSRMEYCDHLRNHMGEILKSGHHVLAYNDDPFFFDISKVHKPADRIAYSLRKVASALVVKGGAELAEEEGLVLPAWADGLAVPLSKHAQRKIAVARKLAEIEKVIDGFARGEDNTHLQTASMGCPSDIPPCEMEKLQKAKLLDALEGLGSAQICLSLRDFFKLVLGSEFSKVQGDVDDAEGLLPGLISRISDRGELGEIANDSSYDPEGGAVPGFVKDILSRLVGGHSMSAEPTRRRITIAIVRGGNMPEKRAGFVGQSKRADHLAKEYAKYLLSFGLHAERNEEGRELTVLRNRFKV